MWKIFDFDFCQKLYLFVGPVSRHIWFESWRDLRTDYT
jgi:hypothetical protein